MRAVLLALTCAAAVAFSGCGSSDADERTPAAPKPAGEDLGAIKTYLLDHTKRLHADVVRMRENADAYHDLAASTDFDARRLLAEYRTEVAKLLGAAKQTYVDANPAYEEMEGVVAGVPQLADYDVIIDAGGDASDPQNAVPFSIKTEDGRSFKQPGNLFLLVEASLYGTEPKFAAKGVQPDLDGDGKVAFGEALPDPRFYAAALKEFERQSAELDAAAQKWSPNEQDALTALVVMTPTMSEYFEAWKNSRFIAGGKATEKAFVSSSRLQDIADILGGLELIYANVAPRVAEATRSRPGRPAGR